tara:strand:- start:279 stop:395 length:117 start_codon:yes stop_codon:yes gene_type:complete
MHLPVVQKHAVRMVAAATTALKIVRPFAAVKVVAAAAV